MQTNIGGDQLVIYILDKEVIELYRRSSQNRKD